MSNGFSVAIDPRCCDTHRRRPNAFLRDAQFRSSGAFAGPTWQANLVEQGRTRNMGERRLSFKRSVANEGGKKVKIFSKIQIMNFTMRKCML